MQYKYEKNLYKILFIVILLSFIISLAGCSWLSLGLLNIFDPQAQIRISELNVKDDGTVDMKIFSLNQVEFIGSGFEFDYYRGASRVTSLDCTVGAYYYIFPSSSPGEAGAETEITGLYLYSAEVLEYVKTYSAFNEIFCDLYIVGTDGAGHDLKVKVASGLPALGVDNTPPTANITVTPPISGYCPLTVIFDGSGSNDGGGIGIAKYEWYVVLSDSTTSFTKTDISFNYTFSCNLLKDSDEVITVSLTVTDYHGNEDSDAKTITISKPESDGGCP